MDGTLKDTTPQRLTRDGRPARQNGAAIKALREKDGWSQTALAKAAGIRQATLSAIESEASSASVITLNRLARKLCVPVGAIMRDSAPEPTGVAA